jgi:SAM-dependent methyltransferase
MLKARTPVIRRWYDLMSRVDRDADMTLMNYGWAGTTAFHTPVPLEPCDEVNRYCLQLYNEVAGAVDLAGRSVLEIGSGRGGGASFISRYLKPGSVTGLELSPKAVEFCRNHYSIPGLVFLQGNAEQLDFPTESFDAVVNIESSHCYGSISGFFREVHRVLKPGGHFLYSDYCTANQIDNLRDGITEAGFSILQETDISMHVLKALELDDGRKRTLIRHKIPGPLRGLFYEFAGLQGTRSYNSTLRRGEKIYFRYTLQRFGAAPGH